MGASNSHSHYEYGFPPRKSRQQHSASMMMNDSDSNHFDKNYLIEGAEFWSEKRYREDCYFRPIAGKRGGKHIRDISENIYQKAPTEYIWSNSSSYSSSTISSTSSSSFGHSLPKQRSDDLGHSQSMPPPLIPRNSLQNMTKSAANSPHRPPGIQPKYLPSFGQAEELAHILQQLHSIKISTKIVFHFQ